MHVEHWTQGEAHRKVINTIINICLPCATHMLVPRNVEVEKEFTTKWGQESPKWMDKSSHTVCYRAWLMEQWLFQVIREGRGKVVQSAHWPGGSVAGLQLPCGECLENESCKWLTGPRVLPGDIWIHMVTCVTHFYPTHISMCWHAFVVVTHDSVITCVWSLM